jgi:AraC family ethanolamine operon transcriptional activator
MNIVDQNLGRWLPYLNASCSTAFVVFSASVSHLPLTNPSGWSEVDNTQKASFGSAGRIDIDDVHAYPESMGQWDLDINQISAGKFHAHIEYIEVAGMLLYREHFSRRAVITASTPTDSYLFGCSRSGDPVINWCGKYLQYHRLAFCHPATEIRAITPNMNEYVILEVPRHQLEQIVPGMDAASLLKFNQYIRVDADRGAQFIRMIDQTISQYLAHGEKLNDERECRAIELQLIDQLTDLILQDVSDMEDTSSYIRTNMLNDALDFIHSQRAPITLPELAAAIKTTPRTLQRAFHETLNISPLKYQRMHRINAAHNALCTANKRAATVTDIALEWGFRELGRFACEYRQFFYESPATTLARSSGTATKDMYSFIHK